MRYRRASLYLLFVLYTQYTVARAQVDLPPEQGEEEYIPPSAPKKSEKPEQTARAGSADTHVSKEKKEASHGEANGEEKHEAEAEHKAPAADHGAGDHPSGTEKKDDAHHDAAGKKEEKHAGGDEHGAAAADGAHGQDAAEEHHGEEAPAEGHTAAQRGGHGLVWFGVVFIVLLVLVFALT